MTLPEFLNYTLTQNCEYFPIEGGNLTGIGVKLRNKGNNRTYYLQIYQGGDLTDKTITAACDKLITPYPPHLRLLME